MNRAERLHALLDVLRAARLPLSAGRLAREFGVSTRTVERDLTSLRAAGVPVLADQGVRGGYAVLHEPPLPPLDLSASESLAVLAGLDLLESSPHGDAARRARTKVLAVLAQDGHAPVQETLFPPERPPDRDPALFEADPSRWPTRQPE